MCSQQKRMSSDAEDGADLRCPGETEELPGSRHAVTHFEVTVCMPLVDPLHPRAAVADIPETFGQDSELFWDRGWLWDSWRVARGSDGVLGLPRG
jgi:hypothetical protein